MSTHNIGETNLLSPNKIINETSNHNLSSNPTVLDWDVEQVALWVGSLGLGIYSGSFKENDITGDILIHLDHSDLMDIGVKSVGHRLHILKAVYHLVITEGLKLDHCYTPPSVKILQDQGHEGLDVTKVLNSFELRDERISYAELEIKKITESFQRLRQDLLPVFKLVKEFKPLPTPDSTKTDQTQATSATLQKGFSTNLGSDNNQGTGSASNPLKISGSSPLQSSQQMSPSLTNFVSSPASTGIYLTQTPPSGQAIDNNNLSVIEQPMSRSSSLPRLQYSKSDSQNQNQNQTTKLSRNPPPSPRKRQDNPTLFNNTNTTANNNLSNINESNSRNLEWQYGANVSQVNQNSSNYSTPLYTDTGNSNDNSKLSSISPLSDYSSTSSSSLSPTPTFTSVSVDIPPSTSTTCMSITSPLSTTNETTPTSASTFMPSITSSASLVSTPTPISGVTSISNLVGASTESLPNMLSHHISPTNSTLKQGNNNVNTGSSSVHSSGNSEPFKSFRVTVDDPCYKVLPAALKRYKIHADYRQYALLVCYNDKERVLGLQEKPLRIFKELQDAGKNPVFMLRMLDRRGQTGEVVKTVPGGVL
ncbi:hypothetical protein NADFUDRAFT_50515 [Nadsonia fulvescens var. elongata DSM 6958]|uniref:RA-domain-containing protein n=1 Tax=Nadsonia fulvescens var. elongata DSM 6958 TaxID=857566 RepID=A0A1E3PMS7_9ASCO|nr:hypothetical protein NADFUDRAFT_50515 [Nadsonia fulvescens var. elongata DSM 6958]